QNVQVEHELSNLLLELLDVLVLERLLILGARPQRVFRPEEKSLSPLLALWSIRGLVRHGHLLDRDLITVVWVVLIQRDKIRSSWAWWTPRPRGAHRPRWRGRGPRACRAGSSR